MRLSAQDVAVIEQALRQAINNGFEYQAAITYRELLTKIQRQPVGEGYEDERLPNYALGGSSHSMQSDMNELL